MTRLFTFLLGSLLAAASAAAHSSDVTVEEISAPAAAATASGSSALAVSPEGTAWLTWLETAENQPTALRFSTFDAAAKRWAPARTIAIGPALHAGASDFPALTVGRNGRATVLWYVKNPPSPETAHLHHGAGYHAVTSSTTDGGRTWSAPARLSTESDINEFAALATLADGRVLAVWLDARVKKIMGAHPDHKSGAHGDMKLPQQLYSRIVAPAEAVTPDVPDTLVEYAVCDCCHTALTAFPDGSALVAYRGRGDGELRDIRIARFRGIAWNESRWLNSDDWRIAGCPVNGPQLASDGGRVAAAWFTAADNDPRVLASFSPDAGARFLMPLRLSEPKPAGRVSTLLLRDGALLVSWVDAAGALVLRRVTPDYALSISTTLARPEDGRIKGFPRLALLRDYTGGNGSAQLLATFTREGSPATLGTLLITVPEGAFLEAANSDCGCAPTPEQLQGFPIRGKIVAVQPDRGLLRLAHPTVPGMLLAGTSEFQIAPALLANLQPNREILARFERNGEAWRLFDIRVIASAK